MASYSMNIGEQGVEQNRECIEVGFDNVSQYTSKASVTETTVPYEAPKMMLHASVESSDTMKPDLGPTAHDITRSTRNG